MRIASLLRLVVQLLCLSAATLPAQAQPQPHTSDGARPADPAGEVAPAVIFESLSQALRDNYPMLELAGLSGDQWVTDYRAKVAAAPNRETAFAIMDELVCSLNDYHTRFSWPGKPQRVPPPVRVEPVLAQASLPAGYGIWGMAGPPPAMPVLAGVAIAVVEADPACGLKAGDEIIALDGVPVREALARAWPHAVGSSAAGKLRAAADQMLLGAPDSELKLKVRRQNPAGEIEAIIVAARRSKSLTEPLISSAETGGVPVIRITRWSNRNGEDLIARFDEILDGFRNRPGLILDVRGNGGGDDEMANQVIGRFLSRAVISSIFFARKAPSLDFERTVDFTQPRGPWRYEGRVAVLTDEGSMSACEHFVSGMIEAGAMACGTPTSGAGGWIRTVELPGGARLNVSRTFPLHSGGIPSPGLGMAPHLWAPRNLADLRAGQDTALRAACAWLQSSAALPPRLQPLSPLSR